MRIVFCANHDASIYNFRLELVERLLQDGHEVIIVSPYGNRIEDLKSLGCQYVKIDMDRHGTNLVKELKLLANYKKALKSIKPNMVFTYTIKPNIYGAMACKALKIPCVVNITGLGTAVEQKGVLQKITLALYKIALKKVQTIFFQNEENMRFFSEKKLYPEKHKLLPGSGVNLKKFAVQEYPDDKIVRFVFVARLMKEKGIDQYLEAAEYIKKKYPNTEFHICGFCEDEYKDKLEKLKGSETVIYHGMVGDMTEIYRNMHCTVHPTYYPEGLSNVLLESCACARLIITTDRAGCREVIEDGVNGFVVKEKDSQDLIDKIEKFLSLSYEEKIQMGLNGRAKVEREFDRNIVIDAYLKELKRLSFKKNCGG